MCSWLKASQVAQWSRITCQCRRLRWDPWVGKIPCRSMRHPTPVFLSAEFHGQRSLAGYSPWCHKESEITEHLSISSVQFSSVSQLCPTLCHPWIAARQASLSITNSRSSLRLMSIESVMPSSHLILCRPLLLLPPIPPSISLFQWVNSSHEVAKVLEFQL